MALIIDALIIVLLVLGTAFAIFGVVGVIRLPDTYSRLHASGKTSTLSILFFCVAVGLILPEAAPKLAVLAVFLVFSGPVASHAIASAVHRSNRVRASEKPKAESDDDTAAQRA